MTELIIKSENKWHWSIKGKDADKDLNALIVALCTGLKMEQCVKRSGVGDARIVFHNGKSELHTNSLSRKQVLKALKKVSATLLIVESK